MVDKLQAISTIAGDTIQICNATEKNIDDYLIDSIDAMKNIIDLN